MGAAASADSAVRAAAAAAVVDTLRSDVEEAVAVALHAVKEELFSRQDVPMLPDVLSRVGNRGAEGKRPQ